MISNFRHRLKYLRESRGWTQDQLAQLASIDTRTVARLEAGENAPSPERLPHKSEQRVKWKLRA